MEDVLQKWFGPHIELRRVSDAATILFIPKGQRLSARTVQHVAAANNYDYTVVLNSASQTHIHFKCQSDLTSTDTEVRAVPLNFSNFQFSDQGNEFTDLIVRALPTTPPLLIGPTARFGTSSIAHLSPPTAGSVVITGVELQRLLNHHQVLDAHFDFKRIVFVGAAKQSTPSPLARQLQLRQIKVPHADQKRLRRLKLHAALRRYAQTMPNMQRDAAIA
ncbi:MAG: hypothetical protein CL678_00720 [Bdellovibrionaceae bacterium]|nr:hypothetical protein [Pseudobdellovibrionaceae bacterium]|tara:strand:- start:630 stop:1286 length:657 start_codon:yes stop_codon:yes gene_type:complete